jgi:hypothetical protein
LCSTRRILSPTTSRKPCLVNICDTAPQIHPRGRFPKQAAANGPAVKRYRTAIARRTLWNDRFCKRFVDSSPGIALPMDHRRQWAEINHNLWRSAWERSRDAGSRGSGQQSPPLMSSDNERRIRPTPALAEEMGKRSERRFRGSHGGTKTPPGNQSLQDPSDVRYAHRCRSTSSMTTACHPRALLGLGDARRIESPPRGGKTMGNHR